MFLKEEDSFMLFTPVPLGKKTFPREVLRSDAKACLKAGPCGLGEKAVYLNSFFVDRRFYAAYSEISRVFKRVAMSKGGFTAKGMFSSIPYLVVQLRDGTEKQCNFKYEEQVDEFIIEFKKRCPGIPTVSREGERRLAEERAKEEARYLKTLSPEAEETLKELRTAKAYLEEKGIPIDFVAGTRIGEAEEGDGSDESILPVRGDRHFYAGSRRACNRYRLCDPASGICHVFRSFRYGVHVLYHVFTDSSYQAQ